MSLSLFLILFYEKKKIKDTILKKKIDSKDDILAIDFLKLFQIINFTNSNLSYLKKKELFNYFLNNYNDYYFINELINIAEYNLADFKLLKITTKKRDDLIKKLL